MRTNHHFYNPDHLHLPKEVPPQPEIKHHKLISKKSEEIANRSIKRRGQTDIIERLSSKSSQNTRSNSETSNSINSVSRKLTKDEQENLLSRISQPRQKHDPFDDDEYLINTKKIISDPTTFERLVQLSLRRDISEADLPSSYRHMNEMSKKLTDGLKSDLYHSSLRAQAKKERQSKINKEWQELQELTECTFRPKINKKPVSSKSPTRPPFRVHGHDDHVTRMKKAQAKNAPPQQTEEVSPAVVSKPFSFEERAMQFGYYHKQEVDRVLSEINKLLRIL